MKTAIRIIDSAMIESKKACLAFSGGSDSVLLLDIVFRHTDHRPIVIFADSQMEYPETETFCREVCKIYGAELHVARANRTPEEQWQKQGWPMMGKIAARTWMQRHKKRSLGFKIDVSSCCRNMKIAPARNLAVKLGCDLQLTGVRGSSDDMLRGLRTIKDGHTHYVKTDKLTICNPLTGWTDTMGRRYRDKHQLPIHPAKARGAMTIGCVCCGGGSQFTISAFRLLRSTWPEAWHKYIVDLHLGEIILSIKYDVPLDKVKSAIQDLGGLETLAKNRPWLFDFTAKNPRPGYEK
ncbi:MAG: phosphoadenosine phosphosulfate reductase family protein [Proteobacteria bacterium]|nr:phosphoadenosine phosphosulfate reductase family protein [Pseudomonadota bacterium]